VEGSEPVFVSAALAYAHPDVMYREFENLGRLFSGKAFRRLNASPLQDTAVNDCARVSGELTLQPYDALFLVRETKGGFQLFTGQWAFVHDSSD
jgi:hypothetical protein